MRPIHALLLTTLLAATGCGGADSSKATLPESDAVTALEIRNLSAPFPHIYCSGQPTEAQFDGLRAAGVKRMLHLRAPTEKGTGWEEERAAEAGVEFERLVIAGPDALSRENVETFAKRLTDAGDDTMLVSCGSSNRVGALFALKAAWLDGKSTEEALAIGKRAGMTRMQKPVEQLLTK